jgi:shikimate dehydrogenase
MTKIDQYAVFGHPISHSKSPKIHQLFASQVGHEIEYLAQEVRSENFSDAAETFFSKDGKGINCTVPLKELAWQYADNLTERAQSAKAVNTLARLEDGSILGDNTDGIGLVNDLTQNHNIPIRNSRILILGAGGACRGIVGPLLGIGPAQLMIANRNLDKAALIVKDFLEFGPLEYCEYSALPGKEFDLIINATSASLAAEIPPLSANLIAENGICYDLAYAATATAFVKWGNENRALKSMDGLGMLVEQAAEAFYLWRGVRPLTSEIINLLNKERSVARQT